MVQIVQVVVLQHVILAGKIRIDLFFKTKFYTCPFLFFRRRCYNGGQCLNGYGQAYCSCPYNYRGRRCELRYNPYNYVYLYYNPYQYGKK